MGEGDEGNENTNEGLGVKVVLRDSKLIYH